MWGGIGRKRNREGGRGETKREVEREREQARAAKLSFVNFFACFLFLHI